MSGLEIFSQRRRLAVLLPDELEYPCDDALGERSLLIFVRMANGESVPIQLIEGKVKLRGRRKWLSENPKVQILRFSDGRIETDIADNIDSTPEEIIEQLLSNLNEEEVQQSGGIEYVDLESETPDEFVYPYDPETIRIDTKPFNISLVYEMIEDGDINLSPDFQRKFVWTDSGARSRLIESIMLRIPLPVFYMAQDRSGQLQVVDGLQRLTVIQQFLSNKLRLKDLEYLKNEEGKYFKHEDPNMCIDQRYRKRVMQTQILVNIIDPQTPVDVKFDIFKRINQGGRPLNAQEIRNCMSSPATRLLIQDLCNSNEFLDATCHSIGSVRMQDQELILRFLAFRLSEYEILEEYSGSMDRFLDKAIDALNDATTDVLEALKDSFLNAMTNATHLFGSYAFRKCLPEHLDPDSRRRLINSSLFTTWSLALADYSFSDVYNVPSGQFAYYLAEELESDEELFDSVTSGTNDRRRISYALNVFSSMCKEHI
ncbi:DUF262 domain-containing protein [Pseudomonas sp. NPDC089406]|uniref:DUF262 domain-containing protein n=1 Tax=Pseudomonas sp. NPDC089406 TaxID=3364463 RepID=UPI00384FB69C